MSQRATLIPLKEKAMPLKNKVPHDQLRPYLVSELHKEDSCSGRAGSAENDSIEENYDRFPSDDDGSLPDDNLQDETLQDDSIKDRGKLDKNKELKTYTIDDIEDDNDGSKDYKNKDEDKVNKNENSTGDNGIVSMYLEKSCKSNQTNEEKPKSNKQKNQLKVLSTQANRNPEKLSSTILEQDFWLTDEHIDHAQWLLQQRFAGCKGLHSVLAFEAKPLR